MYEFTRAAEIKCKAPHIDARMFMNEDRWGVLVQLPCDLAEAIHTEGFDSLPDGSEFKDLYCGSHMKCIVGRAAFYVDSYRVADDSEYKHKLFC